MQLGFSSVGNIKKKNRYTQLKLQDCLHAKGLQPRQEQHIYWVDALEESAEVWSWPVTKRSRYSNGQAGNWYSSKEQALDFIAIHCDQQLMIFCGFTGVFLHWWIDALVNNLMTSSCKGGNAIHMPYSTQKIFLQPEMWQSLKRIIWQVPLRSPLESHASQPLWIRVFGECF